MKLVNAETGEVMEVGKSYPDFRGDMLKLLSFEAPRHSSSTGRVTVEMDNGQQTQYYPSVIGAKIVE